ncbi:MAG: hypothetical protein AAF821_18650 [Cyanobacteria bacterium P01_D01_bin.156]
MYSAFTKQIGTAKCDLGESFMWQRWQRASNHIQSLQTYQDMSPDLAIRHQVNQVLRNRRRLLSSDAWCKECHRITQAQLSTLLFIYRTLGTCSGLELGRVRPQDHLINDLKFPLICWFDWSLSFCDEVSHHFGVDISDTFDETEYNTIADLIYFLDNRLHHGE